MIRSPAGASRASEVQLDVRLRYPRPRLAFGLTLLAIAILSLLYVRQSGDLAATGYDVANLERDARDWRRRNDQLQVEIARLEAVDRVGQAASQRLGMGTPRHVVVVRSTPVPVPAYATPVARVANDSDPAILREARRWLDLP